LNQAIHSSVASSTGLTRFSGSAAVDQFSLVEPVDRLSQGIIGTVTLATHRRFVGWRVSSSMRTDFVLDALEQALALHLYALQTQFRYFHVRC
jgi:hypothetical protein